MKRASVMRILRHRYGITLAELAKIAGVSGQYISDLELGKYIGSYDYRQSGDQLVARAFAGVVANRREQARRLSDDFMKNCHRLLDFVEEHDEL